MALNARRNAEILAFYRANEWSYQLVADNFGVSRSAVAGIVFRDNHPTSERTRGGHHGCPYWPMYTARNWDARSARDEDRRAGV